MKTPQIIMIALLGMGLGMNLVKNGEPREGTYSFPIQLVSTLIEIGLLIWGGFFG